VEQNFFLKKYCGNKVQSVYDLIDIDADEMMPKSLMNMNKIEVLINEIKNNKNDLFHKAHLYDTASELIKNTPMSSTEAKTVEQALTNSLDYIR
jgi:hypothetical protein